MSKKVKIKAITGSLREITHLMSGSFSGQNFTYLAIAIMATETDYKTQRLYALCSWVMQLVITPGEKNLSKQVILDYFFCFGATLDTFIYLVNNAEEMGEASREKLKENLDVYFKRYRKFTDKVSGLLSERDLGLNTFQRLVKFYLIGERYNKKLYYKYYKLGGVYAKGNAK